jgi:hypothetical protein
MDESLLHSMSLFAEITMKFLDHIKPENIVEIGSEYGGSTRVLAAYAAKHGAMLHVIDPAPKVDPEAALSEFSGSWRFIGKKSVDVLADITGDIFFIDGDHNYWTVMSELETIYASNPEAWAVLHDVGPPCDRRDLYYAPDQIPIEHRHPYSFDHGIDLMTGELCYRSGYWGVGELAIALEAGTPKNGVLTAIEDFLTTRSALHYTSIPLIFGLGVIVPKRYRDFVDETLRPYQGPLCAALERNRLYLYNNLILVLQKNRRTSVRCWVNRLMDICGL